MAFSWHTCGTYPYILKFMPASRLPQSPLTSTSYTFENLYSSLLALLASDPALYRQDFYSYSCCSHHFPFFLSPLFFPTMLHSQADNPGHVQSSSFALCSGLFQMPLDTFSLIHNNNLPPTTNQTFRWLLPGPSHTVTWHADWEWCWKDGPGRRQYLCSGVVRKD